jgi:serine/threonine-protein kinase
MVFMIGRIIGNYEITGELAQGGMGAVYRGRHVSLPREVVVKSILLSSFPPSAQEMLKARFRREAYIQSQFDHPNIVRVYEFFTTEENYYLVMEYVQGMSLRDLVKRQGALAPERALPLFKQALAALDYAHKFSYVDEAGARRVGVIHRDIKSANFLLDGMARLKLSDFGIVKVVGDKDLTRTGFNPGTAEYMSPEQIRGDEVDARSDLYSLGVVFYEMLAGRLPFPGSETGSGYEVFKGHIELAPPPISAAQPNVPGALSAIVMRLLEKHPDRRFQSADEFLAALLDYERNGAAAPLRPAMAEPRAGAAQAPTVTHSMTELLDNPAQPDNLATNVISPAAQTAPPTGRTAQPRPFTKPTETQPSVKKSGSAPAQTSSRGAGLLIAGVVFVVIVGVVATAAYFLLLRSGASSAGGAALSRATPTPTAAPPDARLQQAREAEQQERYAEAIKLFDAYLQANPQAADKAAINARIEEIKKLQGLLAVAELEIKQQDFEAARRYFAEALKLRPDSQRAQAGLKEAESKLARPR